MSYFGSVKFFKHLIITVLAIIITLPYIFVFNLLMENKELKNQTEISCDNIGYKNDFNLREYFLKTVEASERTYNHGVLPGQDTFAYQLEYDDLYVERTKKVKAHKDKKVVYLTFDDGPSQRTLEILNTLDNYNIKATFFVVYKNDLNSLKIYNEIVNRGHTIGVHSYSHEYKKIYNSVDDYLHDFYNMYTKIHEITGVKPELFRFPGGSINAYNLGTYQEIIAEMGRRGFTYHDWNVISGDTLKGATKYSIINTVINRAINYNKVIVLMHDSVDKINTSESLSEIIETLQTKGYSFDKLDGTVEPYTFSYIE